MPSVATRITGQNMAGLAFTTANTAGSEPSGSRVAETKAIRKTDVSPTVGTARNFSSHSTADSIIGKKGWTADGWVDYIIMGRNTS
ncbi:hypothetical protein ASC93_25830 [Massilia sp. Root335]|nr:hypothetical protein ASC93_25830 [Massilia sp. Root335]